MADICSVLKQATLMSRFGYFLMQCKSNESKMIIYTLSEKVTHGKQNLTKDYFFDIVVYIRVTP